MGQGRVCGGQFPRVSENIYQAGGVNRMGQGRVCGGQFPRVSENIYQAGGVNRMGQGRVCGGQLTKNKNPPDEQSLSSEGFLY
jgi:hypothetical protein